MNKSDITIVVLLFALLLGWGYTQRQQFSGASHRGAGVTNAVTNAVTEKAAAQSSGRALPPDTALKADHAPVQTAPVQPVAAEEPQAPEQTVVLSNEVLQVAVSSRGAVIKAAELSEYRQALAPRSGPVVLQFTNRPALAIEGMAGVSPSADFRIASADAGKVQLTRTDANGVTLTRTLTLKEGYRLAVTDEFSNGGSAPALLPAHAVSSGPMQIDDLQFRERDSAYLGLDSLPIHGGESVTYWMQSGFMRKSPVMAMFAKKDAATGEIPLAVSNRVDNPAAWLAIKNKFFAQILAPEEENTGFELAATRVAADRGPVVESVSASVLYPERAIAAGATWSRTLSYYVGPKKYSLLKQLGNHQAEIMEFGTWFGWICKILLPTLNALHAVIPNYGVAIILLTLIVRIIFWPVTQKSTDSMKKMQAIQPLVNQIRERYKDKPQKMNQEVMALYKEHKVNPMAGCLPMLIQIPVFIALFTVLRSAIELRFAPFLWIRDLSEPEGLFAGTMLFNMLPLVHSLNLLPLLMTATTIWQQKLTPSAGDPQQQKMMMFMPVVMLFMFYNMASALVLYWTVSQVLAIVPLVWQKRREPKGGVATPAKA